MARRRYKPYRSRKQIKQRQMRTIALVLIALIVGIVIVTRMYKKDDTAVEPVANGSDERTLNDILPGSDSSANQAAADDTPLPTPIRERPEPVVVTPEPVEVTRTEMPEPVLMTESAMDESPASSDDTDETSSEARELIKKANDLRGQGKIIAARDLLNHTLDLQLSSVVRSAVKTQMTKLADKWLFGHDVYESDKLTSYYLVQPGDLLAVVARRHKVPYEILMAINGIDRPELLQAGKKIKVINGPFNAVVYKETFTMDLYLQSVYVKTYRVGLGTEKRETPAGRWRVKKGGKLIRPKWTDDETGRVYSGSDPDYPLGSRWIAIEGLDDAIRDRTGFALHGTKDPETIGTRSSRGCIRLYNGDVIEVYNMMQEGLSEVYIVD